MTCTNIHNYIYGVPKYFFKQSYLMLLEVEMVEVVVVKEA